VKSLTKDTDCETAADEGLLWACRLTIGIARTGLFVVTVWSLAMVFIQREHSATRRKLPAKARGQNCISSTDRATGPWGLQSWKENSCVRLALMLVGEMSLIGPRPLLSKDQPINCNLRLLVRPGITGWAQINGGSCDHRRKGRPRQLVCPQRVVLARSAHRALHLLFSSPASAALNAQSAPPTSCNRPTLIREVPKNQAAWRLTKGLRSTVGHHRDYRQTSNPQSELALLLIERGTEVPTC
jgi:Bacterial sugar transferase